VTLHSKIWLLALPKYLSRVEVTCLDKLAYYGTKIITDVKGRLLVGVIESKNNLAYHGTELITTVKSFMVTTP
jgi:hypothetical protein